MAFANAMLECAWLLHLKNIFECDLIELVNKVRLGQNRLVIKTTFTTSYF